MANRDLKAKIVIGGKVDSSLNAAFNLAKNKTSALSKAGNFAAKSFSAIGGIVGAGVTAAAVAMAYAGKRGIDLASSLNEVQNVVDTTFGSSAGAINAWAKKASTSFGLSELQAKQYTGTLGAMLKSMGMTEKQAVTMSTGMTGLAGDMASFYNIGIDEAFAKIRSGMSGETEPLKQLGINMSVANLEAYALKKGITTSYSKMDQAGQSALRYSYLMETASDAQGDFAKTSGSFANQQRILKNNFDALLASGGQKLMPVVAKGLEVVNKLLTDGSMDSFINGLAPLVESLMPAFSDILQVMAGDVLPGLFQMLSQIATQVLVPLMPYIAQLAKDLMPVILSVFNSLMPIIGALLPVLDAIMPIIEALCPLISVLANIIGFEIAQAIKFITPLINGLSKLITPLIEGIRFLFQGFANLGGTVLKAIGIDTSGLDTYANGGIANRPSIFGEAGPEIAIPLRNNSKSRGLLNQANRIIGGGGTTVIHYSPVINSGNKEEVEQALDEDKPKFRNMVQTFFDEKERLEYA